MDRGTLVRSLTSQTKFGAVHLKAQYYMMTGYLFPVGVKAPSFGAAVARTLGPRDANVPPYIYIGRDVDTSDTEKQFIHEFIGPGFYGIEHAAVHDSRSGRRPGHAPRRGGHRHRRGSIAGIEYLQSVHKLSADSLRRSDKAAGYLGMIDQARAMMDSPVKRAFDYAKKKRPRRSPPTSRKSRGQDLLDKNYFYGSRFGQGLLLARRLVEAGARFVQVEYQYGAFKGFDTHEDGRVRLAEMKKQIDGPIAQLIRDLRPARAAQADAGHHRQRIRPHDRQSAQGGRRADRLRRRADRRRAGDRQRKDVWLSRPFFQRQCALMFGGGFKPGLVYGRTADEHPMIPIEHPIEVPDFHATLYRALGHRPRPGLSHRDPPLLRHQRRQRPRGRALLG